MLWKNGSEEWDVQDRLVTPQAGCEFEKYEIGSEAAAPTVDRLPLPPIGSEDEFHEAWRRGGEEFVRRHLEQVEAEIIAGGPAFSRAS